MTTNDGGPAFPSDYIPGTATTPGMTLRDWFAGQALTGAVQFGENPRRLADRCYEIADAMLAKKGESV